MNVLRSLSALIPFLLFCSFPHFAKGADTLRLQLRYTPVEEGQSFCVDLTADGVNDLDSLQFSLRWDYLRARFDGVEAIHIEPVVPTSTILLTDEPYESKQILEVRWKGTGDQGLTLEDGSVLFRLCFEAVRYTDGDEYFRFLQAPAPVRAFQADGQEVPVRTKDEPLIVIPRQDLILAITDTVVHTDSAGCVQIKVRKPADLLASMQFGLAWDPSFLQFKSFRSIDLPDFGPDNLGLSKVDQGQLIAFWFDRYFQGITFQPGRQLFELCFQTTDTTGTSQVVFSDEFTTTEFTDAREFLLFMEGSPGTIAASRDPYVWPGDADKNGNAGHVDLLQVGLGYGATGPARLNPNRNWQPQPAADWSGATPSSHINFKHLDTDGNGIVDLADTVAIVQNWGATQEEGGRTAHPRGAGSPLFVETQPTITDAWERFPIILGDDAQNAEAVYGLAFAIRYDPAVIEASSVRVDIDESWLRTAGPELMTIQRNFPEEGRIAVALSRIDRKNTSGAGPVAHINFRVKSSTPNGGDYEMEFVVENVRLIDAAEREKEVVAITTRSLVTGTTAAHMPQLDHQVSVYPNPARSFINLEAPGLSLQSVALTTMEGKLIRRYNPAGFLPLPPLPVGSYLLRVTCREGVLVEEIVIKD
jgi:hypothetical protein